MTQLNIDVTKFFQGSGKVAQPAPGIEVAETNLRAVEAELDNFDVYDGKWCWVGVDGTNYWGTRSSLPDWRAAYGLASDVVRIAKFLPKGLGTDSIVQLFEKARASAEKPTAGFGKLTYVFNHLKNLNLVRHATLEDFQKDGYSYNRIVKIICWAELALVGNKPRWLKDFGSSWVVRTDVVTRYLHNTVKETASLLDPGHYIAIDNNKKISLLRLTDTALVELADSRSGAEAIDFSPVGKRIFKVSQVDGKYHFHMVSYDDILGIVTIRYIW